MTLFILIAIVITAFSLMLLVRPLLKQKSSSSYDRHMQNIHFARDRMAELETQLENRSINQEDYQELKREIEANLAEDIDLNKDSGEMSDAETKISEANGILITLVCCLVPFFGLLMYQFTGTPQALDMQAIAQSDVASQADPSQSGGSPPADIETMVKGLEQRMQESPNDLQGWTMLARTYAAMGRYSDAVSANKHLLQIGGENPDVLAALADTTALSSQGRLDDGAMQYVNRALELNPQHPHALWLAGLNQAQLGNNEQARNYWNTLLPLLADQPEQQQELREVMAQAFGGTENTNVDASNSSASAMDGGSPGLAVYVTLADALSAAVSADDVVFVFARALQGPPAPLAVKRLNVRDLPAMVQLTDSDSMIPQFKLSMFEEVTVSARVAKSGNPVAQAGDLQSVTLKTSSSEPTTIELLIENVVE